HDPHQVHVFDALYWPPEPLERWARRRIAHDTAGASSGSPDYMATQGGALRVFYQRRTSRGTTPFSKKLQAALAPLLQGELARWYRVEASAYDHFQIPRRYGWRVLADASADVPDASAAAPARQGARELESVGTTFAHDVEDVREAALDEVEEPGEASPEVELEDLAPPPLNALAEPRSRHRPREAEHEHTVASDEHADLDESSAAYLFDEAELEDLDTDDGVGELGTGHEDEVESLLEGVDLYAEAAEPDVAFEQSGVEEWEE
ncbi:MAG TPA: hypothetical protein VFT35_05715, partial [Gaiellaceae bacterium]|nr:hypothetical protein [Gaiellaceae bacterium]